MLCHELIRIESFDCFVERPHNSRFLVKHEVSAQSSKRPLPDIPRHLHVLLALPKHRPKCLGQGYVIGSDQRKCDIIVGYHKNSKGTQVDIVSRKHFAIVPHERPGALTVKLLSRRRGYTWKKEPNDPMFEVMQGEMTLERSNSNPLGTVDICVAKIRMTIQCPTPPCNDIQNFEMAWSKFYDECMKERRKPSLSLDFLDIATAPSSTQVPASRYVFDTPIGSCNTGDLFVAHHRNRHKDAKVMIKRYHAHTDAEKEIYILSRLQHNHIIQYLDNVEHSQSPELVMPYMNLSQEQFVKPFSRSELKLSQEQFMKPFSLLELKMLKPFNLLELKVIGTQMAEAISYVHSLSFVHGDISLENVLVETRSPMNVKLYNFYSGDRMGMTYPAPEITRDGGGRTAKSDVWSLGLTMMEIFCGLPNDGNLAMHLVVVAEQFYEGRNFFFQILQNEPKSRPEATKLVKDEFLAPQHEDSDLILPLAVPEAETDAESTNGPLPENNSRPPSRASAYSRWLLKG